MLDAVNDNPGIITENNIAVFSHKLHNQQLPAHIPHFIQMLNFKINNTLHTWLADTDDFPVLNMLTQQHTEIRSRHGAGFILIRQIN